MEGTVKLTSKNLKTKEVVEGTLSEARTIVESSVLTGTQEKEVAWDARQGQAVSDTHLEDDVGSGTAIIIRAFDFQANPEAFKQYKPTKQELFNFHAKQIEVQLWADGLKVVPESNPRVTINKKKTKYRIYVGATPQQGHRLFEVPQTLTQIAHNEPGNL